MLSPSTWFSLVHPHSLVLYSGPSRHLKGPLTLLFTAHCSPFPHRPVTCEQSHPYNPCASSSLSLILVLFPKMHTGNECPCSASAMLHWAWGTWLLLTTRVPCMQETGAGSEQPSPDVWRQPAQAWSCCPGQWLLSVGLGTQS